MPEPTNFLKAVFWDNPEFCDSDALRGALGRATVEGDKRTYLWIMSRFLERARVRDVAMFFRPGEIRSHLASVRLSARARRRWERLMEVYGDIH
jgi:hypothetical protein